MIEYERVLSEDDKEIYNMAIKNAARYMNDRLMEYKDPFVIGILNSAIEGMKKDCIEF